MALDQLGLAASSPDSIAVTDDFQDLVKGHDLSDMTPGPRPPLFLVDFVSAGLAGLLPPFPGVRKNNVSFHRLLAATDRVAIVGGVVDGFTQVLQPIYPVSTEDLAWLKRLCFHCFFPQKSPARLRGNRLRRDETWLGGAGGGWVEQIRPQVASEDLATAKLLDLNAPFGRHSTRFPFTHRLAANSKLAAKLSPRTPVRLDDVG